MLVGYVRISTSDDRQSTDLQRDALLSAGVDERNIHEDKASGARDDRPGLKLCLEFLRPGDVLIVWKLDRLGRSLPHLIEIVGSLRARGVGFRSLTESIDTTTAMGEFLFHVFGALAKYERALIHERVLAGLEAPKRRGRVGGRPRKLDAERIDAARSLMANGLTVSAAARSVGVPRSTLVDSLRRDPPKQSDGEPERGQRTGCSSWPGTFERRGWWLQCLSRSIPSRGGAGRAACGVIVVRQRYDGDSCVHIETVVRRDF
jgi:DNA invertase Pin-like site-specific DNA recombinase